MGLYYPLAAAQDNRAFFALTVPTRLLTTGGFVLQGWTVAAVWERVGAVLTAAALLVDRNNGRWQEINSWLITGLCAVYE